VAKSAKAQTACPGCCGQDAVGAPRSHRCGLPRGAFRSPRLACTMPPELGQEHICSHVSCASTCRRTLASVYSKTLHIQTAYHITTPLFFCSPSPPLSCNASQTPVFSLILFLSRCGFFDFRRDDTTPHYDDDYYTYDHDGVYDYKQQRLLHTLGL
jgi:hypothetical protein